MFQHIYGVLRVWMRVCVFLHAHAVYIVIQVSKMLQPSSPQRHPHVLCSLASLISQPSLTHHHSDIRKKNIACLSSRPQ